MKLERVLCTNWLARARRKGHALSHAIQSRQHSIQSDVDLYVVLECLKNFRFFYDRSKQMHIEICRIF